MTEIWVNKFFDINGETVEIDCYTYGALNALAYRFYLKMGYEAEENMDFYESKHPQENLMFVLALEALVFNREIGIE